MQARYERSILVSSAVCSVGTCRISVHGRGHPLFDYGRTRFQSRDDVALNAGITSNNIRCISSIAMPDVPGTAAGNKDQTSCRSCLLLTFGHCAIERQFLSHRTKPVSISFLQSQNLPLVLHLKISMFKRGKN